MSTSAYEEVIHDLEAKRDALVQTIEFLKACAPDALSKIGQPLATEKPKRRSLKQPKPAKRGKEGVLTIAEAIRRAVSEAPRTTPETMDRVEALRPGTNRASIYPEINTQLRTGRLHKDDSLKLRIVQAGQIQ